MSIRFLSPICGAFLLGLAVEVSAQETFSNPPPKVFGLAIHGGAGSHASKDLPPAEAQKYREKLQEALKAGYDRLAGDGTALDAVVAAVNVMENAGMFDAGKGSVFNAAGVCEMDAGIVDGRTLAAGNVAGLQHIKNPVSLARAVMEKSPHVMLIGPGAEEFAMQLGFEIVPNSYFQTERRRKQWEELREKKNSGQSKTSMIDWRIPEALGTVGCVALDRQGNLAAATSTGGTAYKLPGRVGDTPIAGAGTYAHNATCAVSGTGVGEYYMRTVFAKNVSDLMLYKGLSLEAAGAEALRQIQALGGHGGCIAIDREGHVYMDFNSAAMYRGVLLSDGTSDVQLFGHQP
jgi:beta-aspartyl-peptidase (threonine type)